MSSRRFLDGDDSYRFQTGNLAGASDSLGEEASAVAREAEVATISWGAECPTGVAVFVARDFGLLRNVA